MEHWTSPLWVLGWARLDGSVAAEVYGFSEEGVELAIVSDGFGRGQANSWRRRRRTMALSRNSWLGRASSCWESEDRGGPCRNALMAWLPGNLG